MASGNLERLRIFGGVLAFFVCLSLLVMGGFWVHRTYVVQPIADRVLQIGRNIERGLDALALVDGYDQHSVSCVIRETSRTSKLVTVERIFQHSCEYRCQGWLADKYARLTATFRAQAGIDLSTGEIVVQLNTPSGDLTAISAHLQGRGVVIACDQVGTSNLVYADGMMARLKVEEMTELSSRLNREARERAEADEELKRMAEECARQFILSAAQGNMPESQLLD